MSPTLLTRLTGLFFVVRLGGLGCLLGSGRSTLLITVRFELSAGLGEPWCWDGGIPQGCPLSMVFIVALYVPWCRHLEAIPAC